MKQQDTPETDTLYAIIDGKLPSIQFGEMFAHARRLERQRDELLAALKLMRDAWDMSDETKAKRERRAKAWVTSNAAIAAATGEKA